MKTTIYTLLFLPAFLNSCSTLTSPVAHGVKATDHGLIGAGEGPAWKDGRLYFTDGRQINRLDPDGRTRAFRGPATANSANGLMFDREGRLIACESGARRLTRTEKGGRINVLADRYEGRRFNTPNDLSMNSNGYIYFTDPRYGPRDGMEIRDAVGRTIEGVYLLLQRTPGFRGFTRIPHDPKPILLDTPGIERPNGILVTPEFGFPMMYPDKFLYICDNNNNTRGGSRKLVRFRLNDDGTTQPTSRKVIFDWKDGRGPDGIKMDQAGRLYVAAGVNKANEFETTEFKAGCYILSPSGRLIDFVPTAPDEATNCAFGGAGGRTLFITSGNHLWSVPVSTPGWSLSFINRG